MFSRWRDFGSLKACATLGVPHDVFAPHWFGHWVVIGQGTGCCFRYLLKRGLECPVRVREYKAFGETAAMDAPLKALSSDPFGLRSMCCPRLHC